jgi:hypothetical protein
MAVKISSDGEIKKSGSILDNAKAFLRYALNIYFKVFVQL